MDSAKCWRRLRPTWIERGFTVLIVAALAATATAQQEQDGAASAANDAAAEPLVRFLADVDTLQGDFEQRVYSASGGLIERNEGTMALDRPGRFRWHYAAPNEYLIVANGEELKVYDYELDHMDVSTLDKTASDPLSLLSGEGDFRDVFDVVERYPADGLDWIALEPVAGTADIASLSIGFDGNVPRRIEFVDSTDQRTRIDLKNLSVDTKLPDGLFEFEPPKGATVLGGG